MVHCLPVYCNTNMKGTAMCLWTSRPSNTERYRPVVVNFNLCKYKKSMGIYFIEEKF